MAGFGSSLVLVKLGNGIKPLSLVKQDSGPGLLPVLLPPPVCYLSYSAKQGGSHSIAKHDFHLS